MLMFERKVTTVRSCPAARTAEVIFWMVVATPLTSSSVSVNHARFVLRKRGRQVADDLTAQVGAGSGDPATGS